MNIDIQRILAGDRRTIARAISFIENDDNRSHILLSDIYPHTGKAFRIGITGPPGAGKSTLTSRLAQYFRKTGKHVGIIAVDPTSPFTGGALLGDRVRMSDIELDEGIFIRSMASRGSLGGLSRKTLEATDILDAGGSEIILIETVGVGQSELDIAQTADSTIVVLVPESGDGIQAMKAGLMEIADLFVLNKSDRPGADQAVLSIKFILGFRPHDVSTWVPDILQVIATEGIGIDELVACITAHHDFLKKTGALHSRRSSRMRRRIEELVSQDLHKEFWNPRRTLLLEKIIQDVMQYRYSPYQGALELLRTSG